MNVYILYQGRLLGYLTRHCCVYHFWQLLTLAGNAKCCDSSERGRWSRRQAHHPRKQQRDARGSQRWWQETLCGNHQEHAEEREEQLRCFFKHVNFGIAGLCSQINSFLAGHPVECPPQASINFNPVDVFRLCSVQYGVGPLLPHCAVYAMCYASVMLSLDVQLVVFVMSDSVNSDQDQK